jgi:hypothetical protein
VVRLAAIETTLAVQEAMRVSANNTKFLQGAIRVHQQSTGSADVVLEAARGLGEGGVGSALSILLTMTNSSSQTRTILSGAGLFVGPGISASSTIPEGRVEVHEGVYALNTTSYLGGLRVTGGTDTTEGISISYNTSTDIGTIQAVDDGVGYKPLYLQPSGGETRLHGTHFIGTTGSGVGALAGYLTVIINSQTKKIPFYNES